MSWFWFDKRADRESESQSMCYGIWLYSKASYLDREFESCCLFHHFFSIYKHFCIHFIVCQVRTSLCYDLQLEYHFLTHAPLCQSFFHWDFNYILIIIIICFFFVFFFLVRGLCLYALITGLYIVHFTVGLGLEAFVTF